MLSGGEGARGVGGSSSSTDDSYRLVLGQQLKVYECYHRLQIVDSIDYLQTAVACYIMTEQRYL